MVAQFRATAETRCDHTISDANILLASWVTPVVSVAGFIHGGIKDAAVDGNSFVIYVTGRFNRFGEYDLGRVDVLFGLLIDHDGVP